MHVPDHLIDNRTELIAGLSAVAVLASVALQSRRRGDHDDGPVLLRSPGRPGPQAATAALVFALQMVNVPVLPGTSGHLLGGALATALIGPRRALLAVSSVVVVQAMLFADGGSGALGVNLWLIAILPVATAALVRHLLDVPAAHGTRWWLSITVGAFAAPIVSAAAFVGCFALGAEGGTATFRVADAMLATHAATAVVEVVFTLAAVALISRGVAWRATTGARAVWGLAGIAAVGLSLAASSAPDGLERVLRDLDVAIDGRGSILAGSPLAGYTISGQHQAWSTSMAGAAGLLAACIVCAGAAVLTHPTTRARRAPVTP